MFTVNRKLRVLRPQEREAERLRKVLSHPSHVSLSGSEYQATYGTSAEAPRQEAEGPPTGNRSEPDCVSFTAKETDNVL